ncbi:hypothetical protein ED562_07490 [Microcystis aeruginosa FACHB-524]|nr:hypothetical protein ED562_07490 [Microcystis aeruginosa FACHB-524]
MIRFWGDRVMRQLPHTPHPTPHTPHPTPHTPLPHTPHPTPHTPWLFVFPLIYPIAPIIF